MKVLFLVIFKILFTILLTLLTQIGGVVYIISELVFIKKGKHYSRRNKFALFLSLYLISTFLLVPYIAPFFGRVKIKNNDSITYCSIFTVVCNRNYVTPDLHTTLSAIAQTMHQQYPDVQLTYLDANFPFIHGFPLAPHLSHNDGKKIDLSFVYINNDGKIANKQPAILGYGVYEEPNPNEYDQTSVCKQKGYWQYDFPKYLTFGITNNQLKLSEKATKDLILTTIKQQKVRKIFIEPHLKNRFGIQNNKVRFHGCQAVRHDDHIHIQL